MVVLGGRKNVVFVGNAPPVTSHFQKLPNRLNLAQNQVYMQFLLLSIFTLYFISCDPGSIFKFIEEETCQSSW